jgi:lysophospholipase L1-like esterase
MARRLHVLFSLIALGLSGSTFAADNTGSELKPGDLVGICGDSITEQRMYSVDMEDYLLMCKPAPDVRSMQFGWSGDTSWGFLNNKLENDVLRFHPTVVTTCFGMNDGAYARLTDGVAEHYRTATQSIIDKFKTGGVRTIIIGSPGCVGDELKGKRADAAEYNKTLHALGDIDKELAAKNGVIFADVFTPMMQVKTKEHEKYGAEYRTNGPDGVHPGANGHLVMAYAFLKAMGVSGDIGTITVDLAAGKASATQGHKLTSDSVIDGTVSLDSTRYPFCFSGDPKDANATTGVIEFFPFNQDLNRLTLIVKNAPSEKMKVTWGKDSKEFTAADLAKGINLAAEFLDNPFSEQFEKVNEAVKAQQAFETPFIKNFVVNIPSFDTMVEENEKPLLQQLANSGAEKDKKLFNDAAALVTPVHHTIKIEAVK